MNKKRVVPFLGAFKLYWCNSCNLPILDTKTCDLCNNSTKKVKIAPPGDIRPAFPNDIERLTRIIDSRYGKGSAQAIGLTGNRIVLLNTVSFDDLMDEIILDGVVIGSIRYNLGLESWDFYPRMIAAQRILETNRKAKKVIEMDKGAIEYIINGYNVLAPGIVKLDSELKKGEAAIAISEDGKVLSTGTMRVDAKTATQMKKGTVMKPKYHLSDVKNEPIGNIHAQNQTWKKVVQANEKIITKYEQKAIKEIQKKAIKYSTLPVSVSFSGGKDSLVCLQLAQKAPNLKFQVLFVNTSLEFPETINYIENFIKKNNLEDDFCRLDIPKERFWENVEKYGPPGKDYRYCCKILKIGPVNDLIQKCIGKKTLSLIGQRAYESLSRSESKIVWSNPWIPNQLNFTPIQNWTALHVWLYIFREELEYNPLYEEGLSRIGCWLCPACDQGTFEIIKDSHPQLWDEWQEFLEKWSKRNNLPNEWLSWGLWRWKNIPKKMFDLADELNVNLDYQTKGQKQLGNWDLTFELFEGFATCKTGDLIIEGTFDKPLNLSRLADFWQIFGQIDYNDNLGLLNIVTSNHTSITISADGAVTASGKTSMQIKNDLMKLILEVFRSEECTGCKVCITHCPSKVISFNKSIKQIEIDSDNCTQCQDCHKRCPVIKFGHSNIDEIFEDIP